MTKTRYVAAWVRGHCAAISRFADAISEQTGTECTWSLPDGARVNDVRVHIDVNEDHVDEARRLASDPHWTTPFTAPRSEASLADGTFLTIDPAPDLTWDTEKEDPTIADHGRIFAWGQGRSPAVQKFIEAVSHRILAKCDWGYTAGRARLMAMPEHSEAAKDVLKDEEWVAPFIVPHSDESWNDGTCFHIDTVMVT